TAAVQEARRRPGRRGRARAARAGRRSRICGIATPAHMTAWADAPTELGERARAAGVDRILEVGAWPRSWTQVAEFCANTDGVDPVLGIHPHEAGDADASQLERLRELAAG